VLRFGSFSSFSDALLLDLPIFGTEHCKPSATPLRVAQKKTDKGHILDRTYSVLSRPITPYVTGALTVAASLSPAIVSSVLRLDCSVTVEESSASPEVRTILQFFLWRARFTCWLFLDFRLSGLFVMMMVVSSVVAH
jgi:hypothetical protein